MAERGHGEPFAFKASAPAAAPSSPASVALDVVEGLADGFVVSVADLPREFLVADAE